MSFVPPGQTLVDLKDFICGYQLNILFLRGKSFLKGITYDTNKKKGILLPSSSRQIYLVDHRLYLLLSGTLVSDSRYYGKYLNHPLPGRFFGVIVVIFCQTVVCASLKALGLSDKLYLWLSVYYYFLA